MRFERTSEQQGFAESLDRLLAAADTPAVARAWADGDAAPGLELWQRLAEQGVNALLVSEEQGGAGAEPADMVVAFEQLGRHGVPGPWVESAVFLPTLLADPSVMQADPPRVGASMTGHQVVSLADLASGALATVACDPHTPRALDADVADHVYAVSDGTLSAVARGALLRSVDPTRRLFDVELPSESADDSHVLGTPSGPALGHAFDLAALATSAQLLGMGERLLDDSVAYVKQRRQFGREIGSYQAIKHRLADVRVALDFARPLVEGAALSDAETRTRDVSAAKVAAGDAAYLASRAALQVHGAVGYTRELDLSLWLLKVRALVTAWGTPAYHRSRVLSALVGEV